MANIAAARPLPHHFFLDKDFALLSPHQIIFVVSTTTNKK